MSSSQKLNNDVATVSLVQKLRDEVSIRNNGCLEDNGDIGSVEQFDRIGLGMSVDVLVLDRQIHLETLEVHNDQKHKHGGHQIGKVWKVVAIECFLQGATLIGSCCQQMEQCNYSAFEFGTTASVNGRRAESFPNNILTDIRSNKQRNSGPETISLLQQFILKIMSAYITTKFNQIESLRA